MSICSNDIGDDATCPVDCHTGDNCSGTDDVSCADNTAGNANTIGGNVTDTGGDIAVVNDDDAGSHDYDNVTDNHADSDTG